MGDLSSEPSMEEILSSIKRIIAEEGDTAPRVRRGRPVPAPAPEPEPEGDEILELSDPMPIEPVPAERPAERARPERAPVAARSEEDRTLPPEPAPRAAPREAEARAAEAAVSRGTVEATRGALDHLSRMLVRPEPGADGTLEGLVREMLRPMVRDWLDAHLPAVVERMVAQEIGRITGSRR